MGELSPDSRLLVTEAGSSAVTSGRTLATLQTAPSLASATCSLAIV